MTDAFDLPTEDMPSALVASHAVRVNRIWNRPGEAKLTHYSFAIEVALKPV